MIRAIIVDDERRSREALRRLVEVFAGDVEIVATAATIDGGFEAVRAHRPDLVFLDVGFPEGDGFELLERVPRRDFEIIFVTAHDGHAVRAFRLSAVDYLLKPVDPEELKMAVRKVRARLGMD